MLCMTESGNHKILGCMYMEIPSDIEELLTQLRLSVGDVARIVGVSKRQVEYWTQRGAAKPKRCGADRVLRYSFEDLRILAITKKLLATGKYTVRGATKMAREMISHQVVGESMSGKGKHGP